MRPATVGGVPAQLAEAVAAGVAGVVAWSARKAAINELVWGSRYGLGLRISSSVYARCTSVTWQPGS